MPSLPAEAAEQLAPRFQKPGLKDPKLLIGLLLIVLSVIAVISVVRLGNKTEPYYLATRDIAVGEEIHMQDLTVADVRLAESLSTIYHSKKVSQRAQLPLHVSHQGSSYRHLP